MSVPAAATRAAALAAFALILSSGVAAGQEAVLPRSLFSEGLSAEGAEAFRTACATGDSLTLEALWTDFRGLATSAELEDWETRPSASRCDVLRGMLAERAVRSGLTVEQRLAVHYERLARARAEWGLRSPRVQTGPADSLGRHPELEFDDRGLIYLRLGEPDEVAYAFASLSPSGMGNRVEGWRYDRPEGPRVFFFSPLTQMAVGIADFRLLDAPWRAMGISYGITEAEIVDLPPKALQALGEYILSFQGLDPAYSTIAYRTARGRGGTELLQDLATQKRETMADIAFAVDSIPDAPEVSPSLRFAWERLRFFDPSSGSSSIWLLAAARGGDLTPEVEADGQNVYRLDLLAAVRLGTDVVRDSVRTVVRLRRELGDEDAVVARIPVSVGPGPHALTLVVKDGNAADGPSGNWSHGSAIGIASSELPQLSDIAVASDSGGAWTRDGETFLAVTPTHVTGPDGEVHLYFEVYEIPGGAPYSVEIRVVPEGLSDRMWEISPGEAAFRLSFASAMPLSGGIGRHHLRLDLSDTPAGGYSLGIRITETATGRQTLPATTPIVRP